MFGPKATSASSQPRKLAAVRRAWAITASVLRLVGYGPPTLAFS